MKLTINDAGKLLGLPEVTIQRWIQQGKIPVQENGEGFFFVKKELEKWAYSHNIFLHRDIQKANSKGLFSKYCLLDAMKRGGVFFHVRGDNVKNILRETVSLSSLPPDADKDLLLDMLLQRERLASTGIGSGVAIPHPRYPMENLAGEAIVTTCFLEGAIDFNAIDGIPVFVLFLMLSPATDTHLKFLSRLSFCLRKDSFMYLLKNCTEKKIFLQKVEEIEGSFNG